ncbi:MAG: hypothetical protein JXQ66_03975, partial [Campylobacterales bacterium]|nr:hypothetical protein [Campylobacterales bacterium]
MFSVKINTEDIFDTIDKIIIKLSTISSKSEELSKDSIKLPQTCFSRCMIELDGIELGERKINFTDNPHAEHIHIFNRNNKAMIRVKEKQLKDL